MAQLMRLEQAASPEAIQSIVKELVTQLKEPHYHHLRRMLSVWLGRVVPKRAGIWETIPDLQDLQEIDAMLEERAGVTSSIFRTFDDPLGQIFL